MLNGGNERVSRLAMMMSTIAITCGLVCSFLEGFWFCLFMTSFRGNAGDNYCRSNLLIAQFITFTRLLLVREVRLEIGPIISFLPFCINVYVLRKDCFEFVDIYTNDYVIKGTDLAG